ncbi:hypothetical protein ACLTEW_24435 [Gordonia lacunae]|uniref:hypothetical protein n=1 Tax=Gordonia TaxID=2053 RepID=UPI00200A812F|nr:hypothetical protein [Gordonia terrae]UPW12015.1 hypothetical protein M1C59_25530 [Gordonia terrae]
MRTDNSNLLWHRRTLGATAAAAALATVIGGCTTDTPPPASTGTAPSSSSATGAAPQGHVVPITLPAMRAPAGLGVHSVVQVLGVRDDNPARGRLTAVVSAVRAHGDQVTVDLTPDVGPWDDPTTLSAVTDPHTPLILVQLSAPSGDDS